MGASSFSLNPSWTHSLCILATLASILIGLTRYVLLDWSDPAHCGALVNRGMWLDGTRRNWQPNGCMLYSYKSEDASSCLRSKSIIFIGDSVTRNLFFHLASILDQTLPVSPPDDGHKHSDHFFQTRYGSNISFFWDPFLNDSRTHDIVNPLNYDISAGHEGLRPALLVLGSGLWYLRYANTSGGLPSWEAKIEGILNSLTSHPSKPADEVVILPVEQVVASKLSYDRAISMHSSDIDAMNSDLFHRIYSPSHNNFPTHSPAPIIPVALPLVFNQMLDSSQTEDGIHFSDTLVRLQANILLNLRCNDILPKTFPLDKTCCSTYPWPSVLQLVILGLVVLWGPIVYLLSYQSGKHDLRVCISDADFYLTGQRGIWKRVPVTSTLIFSGIIALIFLADRTGLWLKEQKQFSPSVFAFLCVSSVLVGFATLKQGDKDLGFLNREQTDEWKGWMQIAILIYHYCGASKISGIYNPIRVLVAAYLFMTGYGHTTFYLKKADFGFLRVAQVMVRLNLLTFILAYTMNTDYISYYFSPLVSMWFLIIYVTMAVGSQFNDRTSFLICKFLVSASLITWIMKESWLLEALFVLLNRFCRIHWSAKEWAFRVNLDLWIVYIGMFTALGVIKIREHRVVDNPYWPLAVKLAVSAAAVAILWFFGFELYQESKFTYNLWHPYISFIPVLSFIILRNASVILRSASSRAFAYVGRCSLETFIIQYHLWLAGDTKGVLLVIPGTYWRPINFVITTIVFIYVSERMAYATTNITNWFCDAGAPNASLLPTPSNALQSTPSPLVDERQENSIPLMASEVDGHKESEEPDTPIRARRWVDRLAEGPVFRPQPGSSLSCCVKKEWNVGIKTKLMSAIGIMWLFNLAWEY